MNKLVIIVTSFLLCCSCVEKTFNIQDVDSCLTKGDIEDEISMPSEAVLCFMDKYIIYKDFERHLTASKEEALKLGVKEWEYDQIVEDIAIGNEMLKQNLEDYAKYPGNKSYRIVFKGETVYYDEFDPADSTFVDLLDTIIVIPPEPPMPSGTIKTYSQSPDWTYCSAPHGMISIHANCCARSALSPLHTVSTEAFGGIRNGTCCGPWADIDVPLAASHTQCKITYRTTDMRGGTCSWQGIKGDLDSLDLH